MARLMPRRGVPMTRVKPSQGYEAPRARRKIEATVIDRLRVVFRQTEIVAGTWKLRTHADGIPKADTRAALHQLDPRWDDLSTAERARIMTLLVERVDIGADGLKVRPRMGSLAREMLAGGIGAAA